MKVLILTLTMLLALNSVAYAHPGRQNDDGGHVCRTNCSDWGLDYGEYHYHSYFNNGKSPPSSPTGNNSWSIPGWIVWGIVIIIGFLYLVIRPKPTPSYNRAPRRIITKQEDDYFPLPVSAVHPPDEDVELTGTISRTIYRKVPFFVAKFIEEEQGIVHTIVGTYPGRLMTNQKYLIKGTNTYDKRYGQQIKLKSIEKL